MNRITKPITDFPSTQSRYHVEIKHVLKQFQQLNQLSNNNTFFFFRSTVTPGLRLEDINPFTVDVLNREWRRVFAYEQLQKHKTPRWNFLDAYDTSYPFHFEHKHNNGRSYGTDKCPCKFGNEQNDPMIQYQRCDCIEQNFIEIINIHILLNQICPIEYKMKDIVTEDA
jgi:hypothetical protein